MKLQPLHDRVLVKRLETEEKTAGGLDIPDTAKEKPCKGQVIATGPGKGLENDTRVELAAKKGINPVRTAVAVDALVPVVNPKNPINELSLDQLKDIYTGKITNWKELGGADANIVVVSRDTSSGTYETWEEMVMKKAKVMPKALLQASNGAVEQVVAKNPNAIGYVGLGYLAPSIKGLHIGKVAASAEPALPKEWPLSRELYVFTNGDPAGASGALIKYILDPAKGQKAVKEVGFVPLAKK